MEIIRISYVTLAALCLTSCAGVVTAFKNDPLQHYPITGPTVYAMTGDRRTAVLVDRNSPLKYCAESLPDAVAAVAAASEATFKTTGTEMGFRDATAIGILQTFQRTENAELSRHMGWNSCIAWAQGGITDTQYHALLQQMIAGTIEVMKARASQPITIQAVKDMVLVKAQEPAPAPAPKPAVAPK